MKNGKTKPKAVQVRDIHGKLVYRDLLDDGSNVLRFRTPGGFLTRDQIERERWTLEPLDNAPGWKARQDWPEPWKG